MLSPYLLSCPYMSWAIAFFYSKTLTPRKFIKHPFIIVFIINMIALPFLFIFKTKEISLGTALLQLFFFGIALVLFQENFIRKFSCFIIFELSLTLIEIVSGNLFLVLIRIIKGSSIDVLTLNQITDILDIFLMTLLTVVIGITFFLAEIKLLEHSLSSLTIKNFLQLLLPILTPIMAQGIIVYQTESPNFYLLVILYWVLCLLSFLFFLNGLKKTKIQEKQYLLKQTQLQLMKEQLAFSKQSEEEYAALRKWNHDSENHLLAMSYLIDMEKFEDAAKYRNNLV